MQTPVKWRRARLSPRAVSKLALSPIVVLMAAAIYGFISWTVVISMTASKVLPKYEFVGFDQYQRLWATPRWIVAVENVFIFSVLFITVTIALGLFLAILVDQKVKGESVFRTIYLYPMALSFIVTGTAWKWMLNPGLGIQNVVRNLGWETFSFNWIVNPDMAIYTIVIAAVWQSSGFAMAIFLAALRGVDGSIIKAAQMEGAGLPTIYRRIIIPMLRPAFLSAIIILTYTSIRSFDLIVAMTGGGPGHATEMPSTFMFSSSFRRNQLGVGAASSVMMLLVVAVAIVPYLYRELRSRNRPGE